MKVLITHVYSQDNKGDAAIVSVIINQLKKHFPGCNIHALAFDDMNSKWEEDAKREESFMYLISRYKNIISRSLYALYVLIATFIWAFMYRYTGIKPDFLLTPKLQKLIKLYASSDLIVPTGGGYLVKKDNVLKDTLVLVLNLHSILLGKILNKPTILYSQSIGPYQNPFQRFLLKFVLNKTDLIIAREDITLKILREAGVKSELIARSVDAGFLFETDLQFNIEKELGVSKTILKKPLVGITVRKWLNKQAQENYELEMAKFCDYLVSVKKVNIVLIPQVTADFHKDDDREVGARIVKKMTNQNNIWNLEKKYDHYQIKALYSKLDYLVGTRFHSVIFSLTSRVPAIGIEYEHKTGGIMKDLGLTQWVVKIEDVTAKKLIRMFDRLVAEKKTYKNQLKRSLPLYLKDAENTMIEVKNKYQEFVR